LRGGQASLSESFAGERGGELFLFGMYIPPYKAANRMNHEERRPRKLLVHRRQRNKLLGSIKREGITIVPLSVYFNDRGIAKVEIGIANRDAVRVDRTAARFDLAPSEAKAKLCCGGVKHASCCGHHVGADPVTGDRDDQVIGVAECGAIGERSS
jgi:hypothetical protein